MFMKLFNKKKFKKLPYNPLVFVSPQKNPNKHKKQQLSVDFSGAEGTLSLRARAAATAAEEVSCVFGGEAVEALLDLRWHKVALSVRAETASLHVDCSPVETRPLEPRGAVTADGHTLLAVRASDAGPVQVRTT